MPLSVLNQALARVLYQQERFGMLGCDPYPTPPCTNAGGIGSDRSGNALIPFGPTSNASPVTDLGTESGDAAVAELTSEEGSVLFKNDARSSGGAPALPIQVLRPRRREHLRHRPGRGVRDRLAEPRGLAGLPGPDRDQPADDARHAQRPLERVHVPAGAEPDG